MNADLIEQSRLAYAGLGFATLRLNGKVPLPGSHGVHDATKDSEVIKHERWPGNIGLACGPGSGCWALDVDHYHGGGRVLEALTEQYGELPNTPRQDTGSGQGEHYLFAWPTDGRIVPSKREANDLTGIDTRGIGGYIVVAPSVHPDTGRSYVWDEDAHPLKVKPAAAPEWLLDLVCLVPSTGPQQAKAPAEWAKALRPIKAGNGRHETLLALAGLLFRNLPAVVAEELARCWAEHRFSPALEQSEIDRLLNYVAKAELRRRGGA
jgi:hypothetical protein